MNRAPFGRSVVSAMCGIGTLSIAMLCGCDTNVGQRASATRGMSLLEIAQKNHELSTNYDERWVAPIGRGGRVAAGIVGADGAEITVSCGSCHGNFSPDASRRSADGLKEFHQGLHYQHGGGQPLSCLTCHHAENYNRLRLADGTPVEFSESHMVCAQCHSKQYRDYEHGAHGGAIGYWDRSRGDLTRKTCVDCHDPHAPAFPLMRPTFKPLDRFLNDGHSTRAGAEHD